MTFYGKCINIHTDLSEYEKNPDLAFKQHSMINKMLLKNQYVTRSEIDKKIFYITFKFEKDSEFEDEDSSTKLTAVFIISKNMKIVNDIIPILLNIIKQDKKHYFKNTFTSVKSLSSSEATKFHEDHAWTSYSYDKN